MKFEIDFIEVTDPQDLGCINLAELDNLLVRRSHERQNEQSCLT